MQSDHRPIMAVIDVEVHKVIEEKRETVFKEALKELGPPGQNYFYYSGGNLVLHILGPHTGDIFVGKYMKLPLS